MMAEELTLLALAIVSFGVGWMATQMTNRSLVEWLARLLLILAALYLGGHCLWAVVSGP